MKLFVYGTLMFPPVLQSLLRRLPDSQAATLRGYAAYVVRQRTYPGAIREPGSSCNGLILNSISPGELRRLDHYEGKPYRRRWILVSTDQGRALWVQVYVVPPEKRAFLSRQRWDSEEFVNRHLENFLKRGVY